MLKHQFVVNFVREEEDSDCEGKHWGFGDACCGLLPNLAGSYMGVHFVDN